MKRFQHLEWCGALFVAGLLIPNHAHAANLKAAEAASAPASVTRTDSGTVARTGVSVAQADAYSLPVSSYSMGAVRDTAVAPSSPRAEDLLPCPLSVPCRVTPTDNDGAPSVITNLPPRSALQETSIPREATRLLPCPRSIPCIATPDYSATVPTRPAVPAPPPAAYAPPAAPAHAVESPPPERKYSNGAGSHRRIRTAIVKRGAAADAAPRLKREVPGVPAREVTLEGTPALKQRAEQSLSESDRKLAQIAPDRLQGDAAVTYDQADRLLSAGHNALSGRDYLTAYGLGSKVSQLIARLPPDSHIGSSSPHRTR